MDAVPRWDKCPRSTSTAFFILSLLVSLAADTGAHAAAIGAVPRPEGVRLGVLWGMTRGDVDDPQGDTDARRYQRLALIGTRPAAPHRRWLGEFSYHRFDLEPATNTIGVDVTRIGAGLSYQARMATLPSKPWLGIGLNVSRDQFKERLTVDTFGFVNERFPDRSDIALSALMTATTTWKWTNNIDAGVHVQYEQALTGDIKGWTLGVLLIF